MIDWINLAANTLWILGCALALAALSFASWQASLLKEKMSAVLGRSSYQFVLSLAGLLFCLGLAATSEGVFDTAVWLVLALLFLILMISAFLRTRQHSEDTP